MVYLGEELLLIEVEPRVHVQLEDALLPPGAQGAGGLLIGVLPSLGSSRRMMLQPLRERYSRRCSSLMMS